MLLLLWVLTTAVAVVYVYGLNIMNRWRCRHLPGPTPDWLFGAPS